MNLCQIQPNKSGFSNKYQRLNSSSLRFSAVTFSPLDSEMQILSVVPLKT